MKEAKFWIVLNVTTKSVGQMHKHYRQAEAFDECERLAQGNPGHVFIVFRAEGYVTYEKVLKRYAEDFV